MPQIIYIAGYGRSGSTVLDTLLGNHPRLFGGGELTNLFIEWSQQRSCSCQELYPNCLFWRDVFKQINILLPNFDPIVAEQITRGTEGLFKHSSFNQKAAKQREYRQLWQSTLETIAKVSQKNIIVDSSKNTRNNSYRIQALAKLCEFDVRIIHLVRDPRAVMWSVLRGSNRNLESGQPADLFGGVYRALLSWNLANASVHFTTATNRRVDVICLRYEDLILNPIRELRRLETWLNIEMNPIIDIITNQHLLDPGHGVAGNRTRRQGLLQLRLDEEWKDSLPHYAKKIALLSWPLAHKYGYDI